MFDVPLEIGALTLRNRAILAPLAGVSDPAFRRICGEFGAGLTYVEMLSAEAVNRGSPRTVEMMARHPDEDVLGVQVTGPSASEIARAVRVLDAKGFDAIDINMGCPVRKIVSSGWGCAFLKDPARITETVGAARAATAKPLSVKVRIGYDRGVCTVADTASRVAAAGADMLTIHGRFRTDDYSVPVRCEPMASGFAAAGGRIAKVGNGDVMDYASAARLVTQGGCDAVMVSRGALGNPWIFSELVSGRPAAPTIAEWEDVVLRHIQYHEEFHGEGELPARRLRKHLIWYACGFPRCNRERNRFNSVESLREAREIVRAYAAGLPRSLRRYESSDRNLGPSDPKCQMDRAADSAAALT
jgi:nifR3 family TIM-barrel protein